VSLGTEAHEQRLFAPDKLAEVEDEIRLFNASLLNGGQFYVRSLFEREVEKLQNDLTEAHGDDGGNLQKALGAIVKRHDALSRELNRPTLAIDECHRPLNEAIGMLFHSNYKTHKQEDVLRWQRYELFRDGATETKEAPQGYPYKQGGPTTLFSGFRWVLIQYLQRPGEVQQTTIFTSTIFSVWEPLLDPSQFSRDRPFIERVYLEKMLSRKDLLTVIETIEARTIEGSERKRISSLLRVWCGRPGFFFDRFLRHFRGLSCDTSLLARIKKANAKAEPQIVESIFQRALERLQDKKSIKTDAASLSVTDDEIVHFLCYCHRLRGGNIYCLSSTMAELVSSGFAIVRNYEPNANGKSVGVVAEPLVQNFLDGMAHDPGAYAKCDKYIAHDIRRAAGTSFGNIAELAIANRIIHAHKRPLRELLGEWGLESTPGDFLDDLTVRARAAAMVNDLPSGDPTEFVSAPLGHVTIPRDGVVMPDVSFFATDGAGKYCLVTIQSKATRAKLCTSKFNGAIRSTSTSHST
jgi:hypothetical protein